MLDDLLRQPWDSLVEVGPGTGRNLIRLCAARPSAIYGGIEASDEMLSMARKRCPRMMLKQGFAEDADYTGLCGLAQLVAVVHHKVSQSPHGCEVRMEAESPSFMLIFRESTPERYEAMSTAERRHALDRWNAWCDKLAAEGRLKHGNPLEPAGRIVSRAGGRVDGPFAEAKELIGGYFLLSAASIDEATAIAEQSPNLPYGMTIEVRQVAGGCHLARSLGLRTMRETAEA